MTDGFSLFLPITKVDAANRIVYGLAASETADKSAERFDYASSKPLFEKWSGDIAKATSGKSQGNVREMHQPIAAGLVTGIVYDDDNRRIEIATKCVEDSTWKKIEAGVLTGFSIGGKYAKRWTDPSDPAVKRYTADPAEISYVDNPCNPDAVFEMVKADGTVEQRPFADEATRKAAGHDGGTVLATDAGEAAAATAAAAAAAAAAEPGAVADALAAAQAAKAAGGDGGTAGASPHDRDGVRQRWIAGDDSQHLTKADALKQNRIVAAEAEARELAAPGLAAADAMEARLGKDTSAAAKPYGEVEYADPGIQSDGRHRYPVDTEAHIRSAWDSIHKATNAGKYSADDLAKVTATIATAWKATIGEAGPPAAETLAGPAGLAKSLWDVGQIACMIVDLRYLRERLAYEATIEGDGSSMPAKAAEACAQLCELLRGIVDEETAEVLAGTEIGADDMALALMPVAGDVLKGVEAIGADALTKTAPQLPALVAALEKAGARMSSRDKAFLSVAHDSMEKAAGMADTPAGVRDHLMSGVGVLREISPKAPPMPPSEGDPEKNATVDTGKNGEHAAPQGEKPPGEGDPQKNATQDTGDNGTHAAPQVNPNADAGGGSGIASYKAELFDELAKRSGGYKGLMEVAHHALSKMTDGRVCKSEDDPDCEKAGSRHSAATMGQLRKAHDCLGKAGAECKKAAKPGDDAAAAAAAAKPGDDGDGDDDAAKIASGDLAKLADDLATSNASNEALRKVVGDLTGRMESLVKRLETIEAQEVPPKTLGAGVTIPDGVRGVTKGQDSGGSAAGTPISEEEFQKRLAGMSAEDIQLTLIKATLSNPNSRLEIGLKR